MNIEDSFTNFFSVIRRLRGPDGCPWDREQTPQSMISSLIEETYECIDAIETEDDINLLEELGDLFLILSMISYMKEQKGRFTISDVFRTVTEKLIRRHPHVFGNSAVNTSGEVLTQWDRIKRDVEGKGQTIADSLPESLPSLESAHKIQKKAAKVGFDWTNSSDVWKKVKEEIAEIEEIKMSSSKDGVAEEIGDLLFSIVNFCRHVDVDPSKALRAANRKFLGRFSYIEQEFKKRGLSLSKEQFSLMDELWDEAKSLDIG